MGFGGGFKKKLGFAKKLGSKNPVVGKYFKGKKSSRGEAAEGLMRENVTKQAGAGQINFTNEYRV